VENREPAQPASRAFQPVPERKLRGFLKTALGLHLAALLLPFLASTGSMPSLSDALLASAVLLAGGAVLALGASGRHG
jgi:hypothetical protein